jgi:hypothetical protein
MEKEELILLDKVLEELKDKGSFRYRDFCKEHLELSDSHALAIGKRLVHEKLAEFGNDPNFLLKGALAMTFIGFVAEAEKLEAKELKEEAKEAHEQQKEIEEAEIRGLTKENIKGQILERRQKFMWWFAGVLSTLGVFLIKYLLTGK